PTAPKEDDMPSAKEIAAAVMEYQIDDPRTTGTKYVTVKDVLWWAGADAAQANAKVRDLEAQLAAVHAQLAAVHAQLDRLTAANTQG
ncbi:hypothetical protein, partial [Streptomyces rochei]